jgi:hypothetical protein
MVKPPIKDVNKAAATAKVNPKLQGNLVFYRVPVLEALKRGNREELQSLLKGAEGLKAEFGNLDKVIATLKDAANRAGK